jgi:Arc/MetJ family transcription regulator
MRTNIVIDDELMAEAMKATGLTTKRAVVEAGLARLIQINRQVIAFEMLRGSDPDWDDGLGGTFGRK